MEYTIQTEPCQVENTKNKKNKLSSPIEQKLRKRYSDCFFIAQNMKNSRKTGTNSGNFSVSRNGDSGKRLAAELSANNADFLRA